MSRLFLIHKIFNAVSCGKRGISASGDHLVCLGSTMQVRVQTYATLEKLSEHELLSLAYTLGLKS